MLRAPRQGGNTSMQLCTGASDAPAPAPVCPTDSPQNSIVPLHTAPRSRARIISRLVPASNRCFGAEGCMSLATTRRSVTNTEQLHTGQQAVRARVPAMLRLSEPFWECRKSRPYRAMATGCTDYTGFQQMNRKSSVSSLSPCQACQRSKH